MREGLKPGLGSSLAWFVFSGPNPSLLYTMNFSKQSIVDQKWKNRATKICCMLVNSITSKSMSTAEASASSDDF